MVEPTPLEQAALRARLDRLRRPAGALEVLQAGLGRAVDAATARCSVVSRRADRFVVRVDVRTRHGRDLSYALKTYADESGASVWVRARALAGRYRPSPVGELCLPCGYVPPARTLVFRWAAGEPLDATDPSRREQLLRRAARFAVEWPTSVVVPEAPSSSRRLVEQAELSDPWRAQFRDAADRLDHADPAPVHGDLRAERFLAAGDRMTLLGLDTLGVADPAYDAGHFLGALEARAVADGTPREVAARWLAAFRDAYQDAAPGVAARNVAFYRGLAIAAEISAWERRGAGAGTAVAELAEHARAALADVGTPVGAA